MFQAGSNISQVVGEVCIVGTCPICCSRFDSLSSI